MVYAGGGARVKRKTPAKTVRRPARVRPVLGEGNLMSRGDEPQLSAGRTYTGPAGLEPMRPVVEALQRLGLAADAEVVWPNGAFTA